MRRFQSAPPVKGATSVRVGEMIQSMVSIRAPREGGDKSASDLNRTADSFNPRPP